MTPHFNDLLACAPPNHQVNRAVAIDQLALYTTEPVTAALFDRIDWPGEGRRLLGPGAGDGMFIGEVLRRPLSTKPHAPEAEIVHRITG